MTTHHHPSYLFRYLAFAAVVCTAQAQDLPAPPEVDPADHGDPFSPVGSLQVTPNVVREGVQPQMIWGIEYPKSIEDLFVVDNSDSLTSTNPKPDKLGVRVVGSEVSCGNSDQPVALWIRVNSSSWELLFFGTGASVDPSQFVYNQTIHEGTTIEFAARMKDSRGRWNSVVWTMEDSPGLFTLFAGDPMPSESLALSSGEPAGFMTQFIADDGTADIGPREILYLFELQTEDLTSACFDCQDLAIVVSSAKGNNGHGNNLDGVDVSNPGQGHGGPNGQVDESGSIDDEGKIKKKKK